MKWFEGSIPSAIGQARSEHSLFVVYIRGNDDLSQSMNKTWEDSEVAAECEKAKTVALQLDASSEECGQFSQIYPVICVPCTYIIGEDGRPLDITGGSVKPEEFLPKLKNAIRLHKEQLGIQSTSEGQPTENLPEVTPMEVTEPATLPSDDVEMKPSVSSPPEEATPSTSQEPESAEEVSRKIERCQELIEQKRIEKAEKERLEELEREKERVKIGRDLTKLRAWQADKEAEELKVQMKKDKEEERKARERVREQIARDRADRAAKYKKEKEEAEEKSSRKNEEKLRAKQEAAAADAARKSNTARIQFRLPDGASVTNQFPSDEILSTGRDFISQVMCRSPKSITLCTTFPRQTFTEDDMSKSMRDLQLAPSAVIVVLPSKQSSTRSSGDSGGLFAMIMAPLIALWTFIVSLFFGEQRQSQIAGSEQRATSTSHTPMDTSTSSSSSSTAYRRRAPGNQASSRNEGNIHRLRSGDADDDDEMGTWNGNSTQQM